MIDGKYGALERLEVHVVPKKDTPIGEAMRAAICLAVTEWRNVTMVVDGREYRVVVNDLLAAVRGPDDSGPSRGCGPDPAS